MTHPKENERLAALTNKQNELLRRRTELDEELQLYERLLRSALYYIRRKNRKRLLLHSSVRLGGLISSFPTEEQIRSALTAFYIVRVQNHEIAKSIEWELKMATKEPPQPPTKWSRFWDDYQGHIGCLIYISSPLLLALIFGGFWILFDWLV